jgi:hypothetical protein
MDRRRLTALAVVIVFAFLLTPSAAAKFSISLTVEPSRPMAGQRVRVTIRTGVVLPRKNGTRLAAVGPWRREFGNGFFEVPLVRVGPRAFRASVRFPYSGLWRLIVPSWSAPGSAFPPVRVRPRN